MKKQLSPEVETCRVHFGPYASDSRYGANGAFRVGNPFAQDTKSKYLTVIVSDRGGWDHISVSLGHRCPRWEEMEYIKRLFFEASECAYQLHVPEDSHINFHAFCLHIWRNQDLDMPLPPREFV